MLSGDRGGFGSIISGQTHSTNVGAWWAVGLGAVGLVGQ